VRVKVINAAESAVLLSPTLMGSLAVTTSTSASSCYRHLPPLTGNGGSRSGCGTEVDITPNIR
jgi:hypothetical protein